MESKKISVSEKSLSVKCFTGSITISHASIFTCKIEDNLETKGK